MVFVMPIPFGSRKLGVEAAGWYVPAPVTCFPRCVYAHSFPSGKKKSKENYAGSGTTPYII